MNKVFENPSHFRQIIVLSLITGKSVQIKEFVVNDLKANFLRLIDKISTGTIIKLDKQSLFFKPGVIIGGKFVTHECHLSRGMGYWIEPLLALSLFGRSSSSILLKGITNCETDPSVDMIRNATCRIFSYFGLEEPTLQIIKRGASPQGGGEVRFFSTITRKPPQKFVLDNEGLIYRVRGVCYSVNVSPTIGQRVATAAKGVFLKLIPNIYISTDHFSKKGSDTIPSSGYALYLEAETQEKCKLAVEYTASQGEIPEDVGTHAAKALLEEIKNGGCFDRTNQWIVLLLMSLSEDKISRVKFGGQLSESAISMLRNIKEFLNVKFDLQEKEDEKKNKSIICSCVGCNHKNLSWTSS